MGFCEVTFMYLQERSQIWLLDGCDNMKGRAGKFFFSLSLCLNWRDVLRIPNKLPLIQIYMYVCHRLGVCPKNIHSFSLPVGIKIT